MFTMQEVFSMRIPKELKKKMKEYSTVDWKRVVIESIEEKLRQLEAEKVMKEIEDMNRELESSEIPAWKLIREDRDAGH